MSSQLEHTLSQQVAYVLCLCFPYLYVSLGVNVVIIVYSTFSAAPWVMEAYRLLRKLHCGVLPTP